MRDVFPYRKQYWYPHMKPYDVAIWERFISRFPDSYERVQYDVEVGPGAPADPVVNEETLGDVSSLYKRKIDVVGFKGDAIDIIELKPKAGPAAVGQVKLYKRLYIQDEQPAVEPQCVIITDQLVPEMAEFAEAEGVRLIIV